MNTDSIWSLTLLSGRQQQQRQLRRAVHAYALPTTLSISVWLGLAASAKGLTAKITAAEAQMANGDRNARRRGLADIDGLDEVGLFSCSQAVLC